MEHQKHIYEHFDAPGRHKTDAMGIAFAQYRQEYLRKHAHVARGQSNHPSLQTGVKFTLSEHLTETMNREWLVVEANHQGSQPQALEEAGSHGATTYSNQFTLIPSNKVWRANPQVKPQVDGPMIAIVVGPEGEEIFCDEHGRVKLHFPWDRYSNADELSSCWVRVSQGWAGSQFGMMAIPRIGHEVIVSFLNGDPDQPIITGRTYHASNVPPYVLPDNKTKTVIRSESHQGSGFNELSFEDQSESEKIYIHAQKDFESEVLNDHCDVIHHDKHTTIDNDQFTHITGKSHTTITGNSQQKIGATKTQMVGGDSHQKAGGITVIKTGKQLHIKAAAKIVINAGSELTFSAGGSFVKIDPSGVHIVGPEIALNEGGSAGAGNGYVAKTPLLPHGLDATEAPEEATPPAIEATQSISQVAISQAEVENTPLVHVCSQSGDEQCHHNA